MCTIFFTPSNEKRNLKVGFRSHKAADLFPDLFKWETGLKLVTSSQSWIKKGFQSALMRRVHHLRCAKNSVTNFFATPNVRVN